MQRKKLFNVNETFPKKEIQPLIKKIDIPTLANILEGIMIVPMINLIDRLDEYDIHLPDLEFDSVKEYEYVMHRQNIKDIIDYDGDQ